MSARSRSPFDPYQLTESGLYLRDNTIADVSISRHGLTPKLPNDSTKFLNGVGGWAVPPGSSQGALVFLERHVASASASLNFTSFISGTYDKYRIIGEGLVLSTSTADLTLQVGTGGTPTYDTGNNYQWQMMTYTSANDSPNDFNTTGTPKIFKSVGTTAGYDGTFDLLATNLQSTSLYKNIYGNVAFLNSSPRNIVGVLKIWWLNSGTAVTALKFIPSSGTITSGSITIYGLTNS